MLVGHYLSTDEWLWRTLVVLHLHGNLIVMVTELLEGTAGNLGKIDHPYSIGLISDNRDIYLFDYIPVYQSCKWERWVVCDCCTWLCAVCRIFCDLLAHPVGTFITDTALSPHFPLMQTQWIGSRLKPKIFLCVVRSILAAKKNKNTRYFSQWCFKN